MAESRSLEHRAFGQALRTVREQRRLTQQQLADLAGLDRTYLGAIERGERNPSLSNLFKLANTLNVRLRDVAAAADLIAAGADLIAASTTPEPRHPTSFALERAAIALKGLNQDTTPITETAADDILHDAARVVAELIETLQHFEERTSRKIGVLGDLLAALDKLEHAMQ